MSTGDRIYRSDLEAGRSHLSLLGTAFGCLWVAGAFGVLIYTLRASHQYQAVVLADEMALVSHATAAEQPAR